MSKKKAMERAEALNSNAGIGIVYTAERDADGWYVRGTRGQRTWVAEA